MGPGCGGLVRYLFFFQAEDGIRDRNVTGVQTCALPIFRAVGEIEAEADVVEQRVAGVRSRVHDGDPEPSAGERLRNAMEPHLELAPAIAEVVREAGDSLLDGAQVDDVHVAIDEVRFGEKLVPVAVRRAHEQRARTPARQCSERERHFPPLVRAALLRKSLAGQAHADAGQRLVTFADYTEADLAVFDGAPEAPGGEPGRC